MVEHVILQDIIHLFWRHSITCRVKIFSFEGFRAIQWAQEGFTPQSAFVSPDTGLEQLLVVDGEVVMGPGAGYMPTTIPILPPLILGVDVQVFQESLSKCRRDIHTAQQFKNDGQLAVDTCKAYVNLCGEGTSARQLEQALQKSRVMNKIKAVGMFGKSIKRILVDI
tara:strand:+ start:365 stop:865 length:501 start_codon:yes stop_codon:yes gene_type:complete